MKNSILFFLKSVGIFLLVCILYGIIKLIIRLLNYYIAGEYSYIVSDIDDAFQIFHGLIIFVIFFLPSLFLSTVVLKSLYFKYPKLIFLIPFLVIIIVTILQLPLALMGPR